MLLNTGNNGNVFQIQNNRDTTRSVNYDYDELNRIKSAATVSTSGPNCWGQLFGHMNGGTYVSGYDAWANLKEISVSQCSAPMLSLSVDGNNRLTNTGFAYDAAGNMTNDANHQYGYDGENRIKTAAGVTYTYDGDGKRVKKDTGKLYWTGTGSDPLAESDLSGNMTEEFGFFYGKRIARLDLPSGTVHYYFSDHLGSASVVTNADATSIQDESDYYPFGGERPVVNNDPNQYKFTGKERDSESNLDEFGARYYASSLGRFMTPDWASAPTDVPYATFGDPQSLNLYGYVRNNPLSHADVDGHCCDFDEVMNFAAGAANAWMSDNAFGAGRQTQTTTAGNNGAAVGDFAATVTGAVETVVGGGLALGGGTEAVVTSPAALTVVGAPVPAAGAAVAVAGAAVAVHGAATAATATTNLLKAAGNFSSGTKQGAKDAAGGKCQNCGKETTPGQKSQKGVTPPGNEGQTDHIQPKSKGGTNDPSNAQHLCRDCNIKKGDKVSGQQ